MVMVINPPSIRTVTEFIAYAKANPGKLNCVGRHRRPGTSRGELFKSMAGVDMVHVPYRGGHAGGDRHDRRAGPGMFDVAPTAPPQIVAGRRACSA